MILRLIILVYLINIKALFGQSFTHGITYGGKGAQWSSSQFLDQTGNRFQLINFYDSLTLDSAGSKVSIPLIGNRPTQALIKYDVNGIFQYCLTFAEKSGPSGSREIEFDDQNNFYLLIQFKQNDSLIIYNTNRVLEQVVKVPYARKQFENLNYNYASLILKFNPNGQLLWKTAIFLETVPPKKNLTSGTITLNIKGNSRTIKIFHAISRTSNSVPDSIAVVNSQNIKTVYQATSQLLVLEFSLDGLLLQAKEPLLNPLSLNHKDSVWTPLTGPNLVKNVRAVGDGENNYIFFNTFFSNEDTLKVSPPIPISKGFYYLLAKLDKNDSFVWINPLLKKIENPGFPNETPQAKIELTRNNQEIQFNLLYTQTYYYSIFKPSFNIPSQFQNHFFKLNADGAILYEDSLKYPFEFYNSQVDKIRNRRIWVGQIDGSDPKVLSLTPSIYHNKIFPAALIFSDSTNNLDAIIPVSDRNTFFQESTFSDDGSGDIIDSKGRIFVSGSFSDSIQLRCVNLKVSPNEPSNASTSEVDGFTLMYEFPTNVNMTSCSSFFSPSGRQSWDSSGSYLDTLTNRYGCDSIIQVNLTIQNDLHSIDTTVRYSFITPGGRKLLDSSGLYLDTLINQQGCDSILVIKLTILSSRSKIDSFNCYPIKFLSKPIFINQSGIYRDTIQNSKGGDSLIEIQFTLGRTFYSFDTSYCNSILSPSGRFRWETSGIYLDTIKNTLNCDSIIEVHFIRTLTSDTITIETCDSIFLAGRKVFIYEEGWHLDSLRTINGCDSLLIIRLIKLASTSRISITKCDSLLSPSGRYFSFTGQYFDTITNYLGCDSIIEIKLFIPKVEININKSSDINCEITASLLEVNNSGFSAIAWHPKTGLTDPTGFTTFAKPLETTIYRIETIDSSGCKFSDSIIVYVERNDSLGFLTNVITPNGDGFNDCLQLNSITDFTSVNFQVFNRWGMLVFETNDKEVCWDGKSNQGIELSSGTYFYLLVGNSECGKIVNQRGSIQIIR